MKRSLLVVGSAVSVLWCAGIAGAHNHVTVDTATGAPGDKIILRAGYYPDEGAYTIVDGRLLLRGQIAVYDLLEPLAQPGVLNGWSPGDDLLLTSDFFAFTLPARLDGGNFQYEIVQVTPVSGGPGRIVWGEFDQTGTLSPLADSAGATRLERSFDSGFAGHNHEQGYALTGGWVQDVRIVAWDSNGVYADSDPLTIRFDSGACPADFTRSGGVNVQDIFAFLASWFVKDSRADFDHSDSVTVQDIFGYLAAWFARCS